MENQLNFLQSFVDDLIDLRQLRDGVFILVDAAFDPNETFQQIISIFKPQAKAKEIKIDFIVCQ